MSKFLENDLLGIVLVLVGFGILLLPSFIGWKRQHYMGFVIIFLNLSFLFVVPSMSPVWWIFWWGLLGWSIWGKSLKNPVENEEQKVSKSSQTPD